MSSTLESEDLENIQLVRMEDVQPSRERVCEDVDLSLVKEEDLETCIVDDLEYDNECVVVGHDEESNIGSMVSIHSEEVEGSDESSTELIVPETVAPKKVSVHDVNKNMKKTSVPAPDSWPTLEILPGGVINHLEKCADNLTSLCSTRERKSNGDSDEMMYACAKCSDRFQHLCSLVKHVRWHAAVETERKKLGLNIICDATEGPASMLQHNYVMLKSNKTTPMVVKTYKKKVVKIIPKKTKS